MMDLPKELRETAETMSEAWFDNLDIDASPIVLMLNAAEEIQRLREYVNELEGRLTDYEFADYRLRAVLEDAPHWADFCDDGADWEKWYHGPRKEVLNDNT